MPPSRARRTRPQLRARPGSHLDIEQLDDNLFRGASSDLWMPPGGRGVFGGQASVTMARRATIVLAQPMAPVASSCHVRDQVIGQALHAATRTVDGTFEVM